MPTATKITVTSWKDEVTGFTGWDAHARTETQRRLRRALNVSPLELRRICREVRNRQPLAIEGMQLEAAREVMQILETQGANVSLECTS